MRVGMNRGAGERFGALRSSGTRYTGSRPGQAGSAIIAGHIDSDRGPGVFFRLRQLRPGDRIYVQHADGTPAVFRVCAEHTFAKDHFPTQKVYDAGDFGISPVSIAEIPHLVERSASRSC